MAKQIYQKPPAKIFIGRWIEWAQSNAVNAKVRQVVEATDYALYVTGAVIIAVLQ